MDKKTLVEYLTGNSNQLQFVARDSKYTVVKVPFDSDTLVLYGNSVYNRNGNNSDSGFYDGLKYYGFFSNKTRQLYDIQYSLGETAGIPYEERNLKESIKIDLLAALSNSVSTYMLGHLDEFPESCIDGLKDIAYMRKYDVPRIAYAAFFKHESPKAFELQIPDLSVKITDKTVIDFIHRRDGLISDMTVEYIGKNRAELAYQVLLQAEVKKELGKVIADTTGSHYKRRRIIDSISDQVTVRVGITKDGKDFMFSYAASHLTQTEGAFSTWYIVAKDREEYKRLFGNSDFKVDDINEILYGKKVLYRA